MAAEWRDFTVVSKLIKSLYGFGGRCFNIRDVCMDFEPCFEVYNLVSIRPQSTKLGQMTNLNVIFHMVGSLYRLVTIRNSPQFPVEFRNGLVLCVLSPGCTILCCFPFSGCRVSLSSLICAKVSSWNSNFKPFRSNALNRDRSCLWNRRFLMVGQQADRYQTVCFSAVGFYRYILSMFLSCSDMK